MEEKNMEKWMFDKMVEMNKSNKEEFQKRNRAITSIIHENSYSAENWLDMSQHYINHMFDHIKEMNWSHYDEITDMNDIAKIAEERLDELEKILVLMSDTSRMKKKIKDDISRDTVMVDMTYETVMMLVMERIESEDRNFAEMCKTNSVPEIKKLIKYIGDVNDNTSFENMDKVFQALKTAEKEWDNIKRGLENIAETFRTGDGYRKMLKSVKEAKDPYDLL